MSTVADYCKKRRTPMTEEKKRARARQRMLKKLGPRKGEVKDDVTHYVCRNCFQSVTKKDVDFWKVEAVACWVLLSRIFFTSLRQDPPVRCIWGCHALLLLRNVWRA